uniref:Uncharacterized protein n=1 Tax=Arundo donax TaxID=35708 RepID=A0A0A9AXY5_ARUDO
MYAQRLPTRTQHHTPTSFCQLLFCVLVKCVVSTGP